MAIEVRRSEIGALLLIILGSGLAGFGLFILTGGYITMQQIETLGAVGQVAAQEQYNQAAFKFRAGLIATVAGFFFALLGVVQNAVVEVKKTLEDLA